MELTDKAAELLGEEVTKEPLVAIVQEEKPKDKNFSNLRQSVRRRIKRGQKFFTIKNPLESVFHTDWSLNLLPEDMKQDAQTYFEQKYIQFGGDKFIPGVSFIVIKRPDNTSVNLLENYLVEKAVPTQMPLSVGGEVVIKSQFVMNPGEVLLVSEQQKEDLMRYIKWRREWTQEGGIPKHSDWLGFLLLKEIAEEEMAKVEFDRPILSKEDLTYAPRAVDTETKARKEVRFGDAVFATEEE